MSQVIIVMKKLQKKTSELIESLLEGEDISPSELIIMNDPLILVSVAFDDHTSLYEVPLSVMESLPRDGTAEQLKDIMLGATKTIGDDDCSADIFLDVAFDSPIADFWQQVDEELSNYK